MRGVTRQCKESQGSARSHKAVQGVTRQCKESQGSARSHKTVQGVTRQCEESSALAVAAFSPEQCRATQFIKFFSNGSTLVTLYVRLFCNCVFYIKR